MNTIQRILLLSGACLSLNTQAQSFGDFLKQSAANAARAAVSGNVDRAVTGAIDRAFQGAAEPAPAQAQAQSTAAQPGAAGAAPQVAARPPLPAGCKRMKGVNLLLGPRPDSFEPAGLWPENTQCPVGSFRDFEFKRAQEARHAFREASKVRCNDCEGGYYFDAWGGRSLIKKGDYSVEFPKLLASLKRGESVSWKGSQYHVSITNIGDYPIGDTPCKQFHYVLKDAGKTVSEYDGMYCEYTRPSISKPSWNEVV